MVDNNREKHREEKLYVMSEAVKVVALYTLCTSLLLGFLYGSTGPSVPQRNRRDVHKLSVLAAKRPSLRSAV